MEDQGRLKAALADCFQIEWEVGSGGTVTVYRAADLKHDRGSSLAFSSRASAFTKVTTRGWKSRGLNPAGTILEARGPFAEEALVPLAHAGTWHVEALSGWIALKAPHGGQYDLGSHHLSM
jgi:hypothetical protein